MFSLPMTTAKVVNYNARAETMGDRQVPAADIHVEFTVPNDFLRAFGKGLRESLFTKATPVVARAADQGELDVTQPVSEYAHVKHPQLLGPFALDYEGVGYRVLVEYGAGEPTVLRDCRIKDIRFDLVDGVGAVTVRLRISKSEIGEHERGLLSGLVKCPTRVQIEPPDADQEKLS